jgi:hypothetical protein
MSHTRNVVAMALLVALIQGAVATTGTAQGGGGADAVLARWRKHAFGSAVKLDELKSLSAQGAIRRLTAAGAQQEYALQLKYLAPDLVQRIEDSQAGSGRGVAIARTLDGQGAWIDKVGGQGGIIIPSLVMADPAKRPSLTKDIVKREHVATLAGLLPGVLTGFGVVSTYAGQAEGGGRTTDVVSLTEGAVTYGQVFIDPAGNVLMFRTEDEASDGKKRSGTSWFFSEHKPVAGVILPHRVVLERDNKVQEEWSISHFEINPQISRAEFSRR